MFLHNNKNEFKKLINEISEYTGIDEALIEKDYYTSLLLKSLAEKEPLLIFKGGSCLSKCFKLINRFSEDIDINLESINSQTQAYKKQVSKRIKEVIGEFGFALENEDRIRSGQSHNNYLIEYPSLYSGIGGDAAIQIETMFLVDTFPTVEMEVSSIIYDYLLENGNDNFIEKYNLFPFPMVVQSLERTFVDKVFALGTHYLMSKTTYQSRHLYDLHKILPHVKIDNNLKRLFDDVRSAWGERKGQKEWKAAEDESNLPKLLKEIISNDIYKSDYNEVLSKMIYDDVTYEEVISSFRTIISELENEMEM